MNKLFDISAKKLMHSPYMPQQCIMIIDRLVQESVCGKCSVLCDGVLNDIEYTHKINFCYNTFVPTTNICISKEKDGSEIGLIFEINRTAKRFLKFLYSFMITFELVFILCEVISGAISDLLLLLLPVEMLLACHAMVSIGFLMMVKRDIKRFEVALKTKV